MRKRILRRAALSFLAALAACAGGPGARSPEAEARAAMARAARFLRSLSNSGGYAGIYSADLSERHSENLKYTNQPDEIWVQPPGTPAVGAAFLRAWRATGDRLYLLGAREAGLALLRAQNEDGGFGRSAPVGPFSRERARSTLDDNTTQGALAFLIDLEEELREPWARERVDLGLAFLLLSQYPEGGWPQEFPKTGTYRDHHTFNDGAINDAIRVLLLAHAKYGKAEHLAAALRGGEFILRSQRPEPTPGWAQQYGLDGRPAPARAFEPAGVSALATARNIATLLTLHLETGEERFLRPIPAARAWLERSPIAPGSWARLCDEGTGVPFFCDGESRKRYDFGRAQADGRPGYAWTGDFKIPAILAWHDELLRLGREGYLRAHGKRAPEPPPDGVRLLEGAREAIRAIGDDGGILSEGRIHTYLYVRHINRLCAWLEWAAGQKGPDDPAAFDPRGPRPRNAARP